MYSDITGAILAGGKSTRMGTNKALLRLGETTVIELIADLMKSVFAEVILVTNSPEAFHFLHLPLFSDIYRERGPLAGIHSALVHSKTDSVFILACDMPLMTREMIEYIVRFPTTKPAKFCVAAGYHQPLAGVYTKRLLPIIEQILSREPGHDTCMHGFLESIEAEIIHPEGLPFYRDECFLNINTPGDFEALVQRISTSPVFHCQTPSATT